MSNDRENISPCIHGEVCRAYMREFGLQRINDRLQCCIISVHCPKCRYYEPKKRQYWTACQECASLEKAAQ